MAKNVTMKAQGTVRPTKDGFQLRFEREIAHPVEKVWDVLTTRHSEWLSGPGAEIELRVGGKVHMPAHKIESSVTAYEPPRVMAYGWDSPEWGKGGTVRWELSPDGDGTRLVLTHDHPPIDPAQQKAFAEKMGWPDTMLRAVPRTLAGWHFLLDALENVLDGKAQDDLPTPEEPGNAWESLFDHYLATVDHDGEK
jgi:uncharacterized protein YndB with AHSA1/START domain